MFPLGRIRENPLFKDKLGTKSSADDEPEEKIISAEANDSGANYQHSPTTTTKSQPNASMMSTKPRHSHDDEVSEEEDNCSLASSTATSARTNKFKVTVPVGPRFICEERLGRRKEYYAKLEEKHKALEKEKQEAEARQKEEEDAAIKQLRKSMVYKANPVPSFYREGPPPKLPLTRHISPKLTRRRSCGDAGKTEDMRPHERAAHQSAAAKGKDRVGGRKSDENSKTKDDSQEQKHVDNDVES